MTPVFVVLSRYAVILLPRLQPIHDYHRVKAFSERCGASVPAHFAAKFAAVANNPSAQYRLSLELAVELCQRLSREGVDHFHLYTLNQTDMCLDIASRWVPRWGCRS